ncbi:hypothetical protein DDQ41_30890 [Streptomyces spongiicola]|uniref:Uncharacterized protein n=1 Tax=Streptomyces spongiicola TaxID=1690221 RepID=A0ABM6VEZ7_9ACTN|nr:hypothetical protein DDQ41_30890 [Streptomyces spongiicola]
MAYVEMVYGSQAEWDSFPAEAWPEASPNRGTHLLELLGDHTAAGAAHHETSPALPNRVTSPQEPAVSKAWQAPLQRPACQDDTMIESTALATFRNWTRTDGSFHSSWSKGSALSLGSFGSGWFLVW